MGEVQFARVCTDGHDTVFAYTPDGNAAWAIDLGSGRQWWYPGGDLPAVRESISAYSAQLASMPVLADAESSAAPVGASRQADLRSHLPGHAVLAKIAELHADCFDTNGVPVLPDEIVQWAVGFVGEEAAGRELGRLGAEWTTLHAVPVGSRNSDIDHVVIGPPGVFTINTKHHRGVSVDVKKDAVFVAGKFQPYLESVRLEGSRAAAVVSGVTPSVPVQPMLVTVGAQLRIKEAPTDVAVLAHDALVPWLLSQPQRLEPEVVTELVEGLSDTRRWSNASPPPPAPEWVAELARALATEKAVASDQKRGRRGARSAPKGAGPRVTSPQPTRRRHPQTTGRSGNKPAGLPAIVRLLVGAIAIALVVVLAPTIGRLLASVVTSAVVPVKPSTVPSAVAGAKVGAACSPKGATGTDGTGQVLTCSAAPAGSTAKLVWHKKS